MSPARRHRIRPPRLAILAGAALLALIVALVGCAGDSSSSSASGAYGGPQNHLHDVLALRGSGLAHTVLLATHIGLYRSTDTGRTWREVAGGGGQTMDGLMLYKLAQSPVDPQRVYVLAVPRPDDPKAARDTPGIYTSADGGVTWSLASPTSAFPSDNVFTIAAGAGGPRQVYAIVTSLRAKGLFHSDDAGAHWSQMPDLPTGTPSGILGDPANPRHVLLWSISSGLFSSNDDGATWTPVPGVQGGIYSVSRSGQTIYAIGDMGVYTSSDGGAHVALVASDATFSSVVATAADPNRAYANTGTAVYTTSDGGHTWKETAPTSEHPGLIAADPDDANTAYACFSFPLGVAVTTDGGASWRNVLP